MANPGDLDTTFGSGGKKTVNFGGTDVANAVLVQANGRIVVAGGGGPASSFCVVRLRAANGTLDPTFGSGGKRTIDFGGDDEGVYGAALQPDGKIVLAGDSHLTPAVARLKANGSLDTTFAAGGKKPFSWGALGRAMAVLVLPNGKILLAGFSGPEGGNVQVARLNATARSTRRSAPAASPRSTSAATTSAWHGAPGRRTDPRGGPVDDGGRRSSRGCGRPARSTPTSAATAA